MASLLLKKYCAGDRADSKLLRQLVLFGHIARRLLYARINGARFDVEFCKLSEDTSLVADAYPGNLDVAVPGFRQYRILAE